MTCSLNLLYTTLIKKKSLDFCFNLPEKRFDHKGKVQSVSLDLSDGKKMQLMLVLEA